MKTNHKINAVIQGKLPIEALTDKELKKFEQIVFNAVTKKYSEMNFVMPSSNTVH